MAITHSTFKDYICGLDQTSPNLGLITSRLRLTEAACTMTRSCLSYLLLFDDRGLIIRDDFDVGKFDSEHKFYAYAAFNLKIHGNQAAPATDTVHQLSTDFHELTHKNQGITWISRIFSNGEPINTKMTCNGPSISGWQNCGKQIGCQLFSKTQLSITKRRRWKSVWHRHQ